MDFHAVDQAVAQVARASSIETEVKARLDFIAEYGEDQFEESTVFRFTKVMGAPGRKLQAYSYAAIKVGRSWFTTGPSQGKYTWGEFILWLVSGENPVHPSEVVVIDPAYRIIYPAVLGRMRELQTRRETDLQRGPVYRPFFKDPTDPTAKPADPRGGDPQASLASDREPLEGEPGYRPKRNLRDHGNKYPEVDAPYERAADGDAAGINEPF